MIQDDENDSESESALMWVQDMFRLPFTLRPATLEYVEADRGSSMLRPFSQPRAHYRFCDGEAPARARQRPEIVNNDDMPSCSGLTRSELLKILQRSKSAGEDGGACFSELSPEDEVLTLNNGPKTDLEPVKDDVVLDRYVVSDDDEAVAVSPCGRFLKYPHVVGMGSVKTVFRGLDSQAGVPVAWCELLEKRVSKSERQRFREEAELLKQLQHPNIVRFYSSWEVSSYRKKSFVLITELMTSGTLKAYLKRFKILNAKVFKDWCTQILKALQYLHSRKPLIIHRDLKCDNIFITGASGLVKIGDLGLSTRKYGSFAKSVVGTPEFMAPEMYEEHYDEAVDIYAFGMCMLEMTIADYPYSECSTPTQIYKRVTSGVKPTGLDRVHDLKTRAIIEWCIEHRKQDRPTCRTLLTSDYFAEEATFKLSPIFPEIYLSNTGIETIEFRLQLLDPKRRSHQQDEAILFSFDTHRDCCKTVAQEMFKSGIIGPEDAKLIELVLKSHVDMLREERRILEVQKPPRPMQPCLEFIPDDCGPSSLENDDDEIGRNLEDLIFGPRIVRLSSNVIAFCMEKATRSAIRLPKLSVTNIENHSLVYCLLDVKPMIISFKFDVTCIDVSICAENLSKEGLLSQTQVEWFLSTLEDIIHQVKRDPTRLPKTVFPEVNDSGDSKKNVEIRRKLTFTPGTKPPAPTITYAREPPPASFVVPRPGSRSGCHSLLRRRTPRSRFTLATAENASQRQRDNDTVRTTMRPPTPPPNFPIRQPDRLDRPRVIHDRLIQSVGMFHQRPIVVANRHQLTVPHTPQKTPHVVYHSPPVRQQRPKTGGNVPVAHPFIARPVRLNHQRFVAPQRDLRHHAPPIYAPHFAPISPQRNSPLTDNKVMTRQQNPAFMPQPPAVNAFAGPATPVHVKQFVAPQFGANEFIFSFVGEEMFMPRFFDDQNVSRMQHYNVPGFQDGRVLQAPQPPPQPQLLHAVHHRTDFNVGVGLCFQPEELLSLATTNPTILPAVLQSDIKSNLDTTRNLMCGIRLDTNVRNRLLLLFQRQYIEEEELRLRHLFELEEFFQIHQSACFIGELGESTNHALRQQMATARQFLNQAGFQLNQIYQPPPQQHVCPGLQPPPNLPIPMPPVFAASAVRPQHVTRRLYYQQPCYLNGAMPPTDAITVENAAHRTPLARPILGVHSNAFMNGVADDGRPGPGATTLLVAPDFCPGHNH